MTNMEHLLFLCTHLIISNNFANELLDENDAYNRGNYASAITSHV